jgi:hypothetical protein
MAFVVARRGGRFEIRESLATPAGPRARTLASFRVLTADVLADAAGRARRPFDAAKIRARARQLRAPERADGASVTARRLVGELRRGERPPPALVNELRRVLPRVDDEIPDTLAGALDWVGVDDATRGRALRDVLELASRVPQRSRPRKLSFPRIASKRRS